ncbi:asparagine synthase-related protein [Flavobacterium psychrophilum]|uniref:asparagine synthase-related protein n=1 Tax=Flavobacterium psychrophilum TaxID=96345 RepID=UPI0038F74199
MVFSEEKHNESYLAKNITEEYNYEYNSMKVEGDLLYDSLLESSYFQDEPLMHLNEPHLLAVSKLANAKVKVLLSGEGADELMGGYVRYKALRRPTLLKAISYLSNFNFLNNNPRFNKLLRYSKITNNSDLVLFNSTSVYPNDIHEFYGEKKEPINEYRYQLLNEAKELYPNSLQRQALYFDQHTYMCSLLDRNDRCTMGASIECREPFLDQRLVAGLGTLDDNWLFSGKKGKYILKNTMQDKLPQDILNFKKIGLSVPWENQLLSNDKFKEELRNFAKSEIFSMPFLENLNGKKIVEQIEKGDKKIIPYIMPLFMLHIWQKKYFQKFI